MILETIEARGLAHLSYVLGDEEQGVCAVIDPRRDVSVYIDIARKHHCRITHIFETHIHADYVSGSRELAAQTRAMIVGGTSPEYAFNVHQAHDGELFELGSLSLKVLETPGHTHEHISLLVSGGKGAREAWGLFTGDTLFAGEVGRPDLLGQSSAEGLARQLFHTLHGKLFTLGDEVEIYPAHGSGSPCGGSIGDRLTSTIGYERLNLPIAQITSEEEFIEKVLLGLPPAPTYYPRMKIVNAKGADVIGCMLNITPLDAERFADVMQQENVVVVDTREIEAFGGAHIPGAINIALRDEFPVWSGWMLKPENTILLVLGQESDLDAVQRHLLRIGITNIVGFLRQGIRSWLEAGKQFATLPQMSVQQLKQQMDANSELQILDVRSDNEWNTGHISNAVNIFVPLLLNRELGIDKSVPLVVYCGGGYRASIAASFLKKQGYVNVSSVPGSIKAWTNAGFPLVS